MKKTILLLLLVFSSPSHSQDVKPRRFFFYNGSSLQYFPRLIEFDVKRPDLFMRLPYYGFGNELICGVYEFKNGKYVLGAQFGTELQEEFAEVGMFPFIGSYPLSYYLENQIGWAPRPVYSVEISRRIHINNATDFNIGIFGGIDGYRNESMYWSSSRGSTDGTWKYLMLHYHEPEDQSKYTGGLQLGLTRYNWELNFRVKYLKNDFYFLATTYSDNPDSIPLDLRNYADVYKKRQYYFSLNARYYYGRKKRSYRYHM
jgi:hypothetical protein